MQISHISFRILILLIPAQTLHPLEVLILLLDLIESRTKEREIGILRPLHHIRFRQHNAGIDIPQPIVLTHIRKQVFFVSELAVIGYLPVQFRYRGALVKLAFSRATQVS